MNKLFGLFLLALAFLAPERAGAGCIIGGGIICSTSVASLSGPGDIIPSAKAGYSFRAWSAAAKGTNAVRVCNSGDAACVDMVTHATTGDLVITAVGGTDCSVSTCTVRTLYDQSGALGCTGSVACDAVQTTEANRPIFKTASCGGKPCMQCTAASSQRLLTSTFIAATNQTFSAMFVANRTSTTTTNTVLSMNATNIQMGSTTRPTPYFTSPQARLSRPHQSLTAFSTL